jgi:hypothetical protein
VGYIDGILRGAIETADMSKHLHRASASSKMIAVVAIATVLALVIAAGARAGTYVINDCPSAPTASGDSGPWTVFGSPQADKGACGGGAGDWIGPLGGSMSAGGLDGVSVAVPAGSGITIHEAKVWWSVPSSVSGATVFALASTNTGTVGMAQAPLDRSSTPDGFILPSSSTWFTLADYCSNDDAGNGCTFGGGENANLQLFGAQLTLSDNNLPAGTVTGGALAGSGPVAGTQSLAFNASEADTGVRTAQLLVDDTVVAQKDYLAQCPYTSFAACPTTRSDTISWNTSATGNGSHEVALRIVDAAGNTTIVDSHTITTSGRPSNPNGSAASSIGPGSPPAVRGAANGTNASDQATLTARWASTAKVLRTSRYGAADRVTGRLTGPVGVGIGSAGIDVYETPAYHGAGTRRIGGVSTGPTGQWALTLPRGVSSGALRFDYRSHQNDTVAAASATLRLSVHAGISLKIAPRSASVGRKIFFSGVLGGAPIPEGGKQLVLEARSRGEWIQFDTIRTNARGRYRATYRFKFPGPITYQFRVLSRYEADFPFLDGTSNVVAVHEG